MDANNFRYTLAAFVAGALLAFPIVTFVPFPSPPADLMECAKTNGADLTVSACVDYLAEQAELADACGAIAEQLAYEACEAATLAVYRSAR